VPPACESTISLRLKPTLVGSEKLVRFYTVFKEFGSVEKIEKNEIKNIRGNQRNFE
jgi:hypothetical protein